VALSLRTRLTAWYAVLLVLTVAVFSTAVLWLHWRLVIDQFDEGIQSIAATAANVVDEELGELNALPAAAAEMAAVVRPHDFTVQVLDASGAPLLKTEKEVPLPPPTTAAGFTTVTTTLQDARGRSWRVTARSGESKGHRYLVVVGAPLDEPMEQWTTLLRACLIGIPIALVFAVAGGLWLGRHGLRPLSSMAAEAEAITARTPDARLTAPRSAAELEQLAASFNTVLDRLGSALSTQRRFMADASHELRTPISIMRTAADVTLSRPARDEAEYRDALSAVAQQTSRLTRLVDDMLVLARADGGGYPMTIASVDLAQLVGDCVRELRVQAEDKGIAVRPSLAPATLKGDEALLRRMLSNLLGNALTYTPRGGVVSIALTNGGGRVEVSVADTGPGIPPEDRERVFERFVRLDRARASGGAGLGLAIARWVAEAHGGGVRVLSTGPAGTVFVATLPA
jgi:two-component system OmpR family sensor kinase